MKTHTIIAGALSRSNPSIRERRHFFHSSRHVERQSNIHHVHCGETQQHAELRSHVLFVVSNQQEDQKRKKRFSTSSPCALYFMLLLVTQQRGKTATYRFYPENRSLQAGFNKTRRDSATRNPLWYLTRRVCRLERELVSEPSPENHLLVLYNAKRSCSKTESNPAWPIFFWSRTSKIARLGYRLLTFILTIN